MSAAERLAAVTDAAPVPALEVVGPVAPNLPAAFWQARVELARIHQAAQAATCSPDAVLGACLARVAALTPPSIQLPAIVGTPGTLDLAVAIIGRSGTGKSTSARTAASLVPIHDEDVAEVVLGSGEGLIESYLGEVTEPDEDGKPRKVRRQVRRAVLATLDEGQALADLGSRKGSTLMPTIRSAWTGDRLGQANASEDRRRNLSPRAYRFALIAGFQTEHAVALLDDAAGGTPQRFLFLPAEDPTMPDEAPAWPSPVAYTPPTHQAGPMDTDADVAREIRGRHLARVRGEVTTDPLDAHRDLSRLKVSGLLALLADRLTITADDWTLAGQVLDASDLVRASILWTARHRDHQAEQVATERAARRAAALDDSAEQRALDGMAKAIARHVHRDACPDGCKRRCATQATKSAHRKLATFDDALALAAEAGWVRLHADAITPGEVQP